MVIGSTVPEPAPESSGRKGKKKEKGGKKRKRRTQEGKRRTQEGKGRQERKRKQEGKRTREGEERPEGPEEAVTEETRAAAGAVEVPPELSRSCAWIAELPAFHLSRVMRAV
jgi:hypothetical protein